MYLHSTWLSRWSWGEDWFSPQVLHVNPNSKQQQQQKSTDSVTCTSSISKLLHNQIRDSGRHTRSSCAFFSLVRHWRCCPSVALRMRGFFLIGLYISPIHKNQNFNYLIPSGWDMGSCVRSNNATPEFPASSSWSDVDVARSSLLGEPPVSASCKANHQIRPIRSDSKSPHINSIFFSWLTCRFRRIARWPEGVELRGGYESQ